MFIVHSNEGMRSFNLKTQCSKPKFRHVDQAGLSKIAHSVGLYFTHGKCRLPGTPGHVSVMVEVHHLPGLRRRRKAPKTLTI
jgi:hypothetical protein